MATRQYWIMAALLGVSALIGCRSDSEGSPQSGNQELPRVETPRAPSSAQDEQQASGGRSEGQQHSQGAEQGQAPVSFDTPPAVGTRAHCPVMGHDFTVTESSPRSEHGGRHYVFCCPACKPRFDANPSEFLSAERQES